MSKRNTAWRGRALQQANINVRNIQRKIDKFDPKDGCKIPSLLGEPEETNELQSCHLISEAAYLIPISTRHHVMHWRFDAKAIKNAMLRENTYSYTRLAPSRIPTRKCTTRYACNWHDHEVFAEFDLGNLDTQSKRHQFLLGFRAIAGSIAEWDAWLEFIEALPKEFYKKNHQAENSAKKRLTDVSPYMKVAKAILKSWQDAYCERKWDNIHSYHTVATSNIRCAAASTFDVGGSLGTITLLPIVHNGEPTSQYDIIGVALKSPWTKPLDRLLHPGFIKESVLNLKENLERNPSQALEWMVQKIGHVAVNPDDYNNRDLISAESIERIEQAAASRLQQ